MSRIFKAKPKVTLHKWLCVYTAPNGKDYYKYAALKKDLIEWFGDREGTAQFIKIDYTKSGTRTNTRKPRSQTLHHFPNSVAYLDDDSEFENYDHVFGITDEEIV